MNMSRKNFLRWSAITTGGIVFGTALPACGGGGGGGSNATTTAMPAATPTAVAAATAPAQAQAQQPTGPVTITASLAASCVAGVAPLYVNFDATGTTHYQSTNPTHELFYSWMFGDTAAGNWANGVQSAGLISKNAAFGPVTGHVFEIPGTYTVNLIVMDGVNTVSKNVVITVQDPNVVYAGTNTICLSSSSNFTGAPSGSAKYAVGSDMYAAFNTYKGSNKRILFCKADSWTCSAQIGFTNISDTIVGGYGTGVARATVFGSGTLVSVDATAVSGSTFATYAGCSNLRICDMKVLGSSKTKGLSLNNGIAQMLAYKLEFRSVYAGFSAYPGGGGTNNVFDQHCMYECVVDDLYGYSGVDTPRTSATGAIGAPGIFTAASHPFKAGYAVQLTGAPPAPLATGTNYFVSASSLTANTFTLSATSGGAVLALSGAGTCTVVANGMGGGVGAFVGLVRGGVMGCYIDSRNHGEQTLRVPFIDRGHINNNYIARPNQGKNIVKIHSFAYNEVALYSEKFVVSANVMDLRGGYSYGDTTLPGVASVTEVGTTAMTLSNGGTSGNERVRNAIVENNITYGCSGHPKNMHAFAQIGGPNITVRNNIFDASMGDGSTAFYGAHQYTELAFAVINSSTPDPTIGVRIYNNTLYSNMANAEKANFLWTTSPSAQTVAVDDLVVKNNLWYLPNYMNASKGVLYRQPSSLGANVTMSNNTDNVSDANTSPNFVATPPVALTDWRPKAGSYAINSGASVPVPRDFNNAARTGGTHHMGAVLP